MRHYPEGQTCETTYVKCGLCGQKTQIDDTSSARLVHRRCQCSEECFCCTEEYKNGQYRCDDCPAQ